MNRNGVFVIAIAVLILIPALTVMADPPPRDNLDGILAIRPVIPDERAKGATDKKLDNKTKLKEIKDFHKALKPLQDAAKKGDIKSVRRSVNKLVQRSNALNRCRLPENRNARDFIKARKQLQKSVKTLSKSCQKRTNDQVISDLNTVHQRYRQLQTVVQ